jgi:hypothetical protein
MPGVFWESLSPSVDQSVAVVSSREAGTVGVSAHTTSGEENNLRERFWLLTEQVNTVMKARVKSVHVLFTLRTMLRRN